MSKGRKHPGDSPPPVVPKAKGPDTSPDHVPSQCWTFPVEDATQTAKTVESGASASGSVARRRILVRSQGKALGFAPGYVADEIIEALNSLGRGTLRGHVISNQQDGSPIVELCIR